MSATYDDLVRLELPDWLFAEIVEGELRIQRLPPPLGTIAVSAIAALVGSTMRPTWQTMVRVEVWMGTDVLVPDVVAWKRERLSKVPNPYVNVVPDWVCEVLTQETRLMDRRIKPGIYARHGVSHLWMVDPDARTLEALELQGGTYKRMGLHEDASVVTVCPFETMVFDLAEVWGDT